MARVQVQRKAESLAKVLCMVMKPVEDSNKGKYRAINACGLQEGGSGIALKEAAGEGWNTADILPDCIRWTMEKQAALLLAL